MMMNLGDREEFDVVIAGAGPAGSAAAIRLSRGGVNVLLVERAKFPREKLCGEFVSPECVQHFAELGVPALTTSDHPRIESTVFYSQFGSSAEFKSDWFGAASAGLGISRAEMDEALLSCAAGAGATVAMETAVVGVDVCPQKGVSLRLRGPRNAERLVHARFAIDATGRKRALGSSGTRDTRASKVAFKTHLLNAKISPARCEIYSYRGGYGGCNTIGGDRYNLCFIVDAALVKANGANADSVMRGVLFRNSAAKRALENADFREDWLAVPVSGFGRRPPIESDRLFFVGDSAAFIDPFTGSGILLALQSAEICTNVLLDAFRRDLQPQLVAASYRKSYDALLANRLRVSALLRPASNAPRLADVVLSLISKSEWLRAALARATRFSEVPGV